MRHEAPLFDDVMKLGESLIEAVLNTRGSLKDEIAARAEVFATRFDLVRREEADALRLMLSKARAEQDSLRQRIESLETKLKALTPPSPSKKPKKTALKKIDSRSKTLRSVKQGNRKKH